MTAAIRMVRIGDELRPEYQERIAALEQLATYPIGDDFFQIDHGPDYFAFFDRLGVTHYYVLLDGERVVMVGCGVLRRVPWIQGSRPKRTWYACDAKVHPDYRGRHLPLRMLRGGFLWNYLRCPRGYGVAMNPREGEPPIARSARHWRWSPVRCPTQLLLWSLDAEQMAAAQPLVEEQRGPVSYLSLRGIKDIILQSTGAPMPLLHLQHGAIAGDRERPVADHVHMLCAPTLDPLSVALQARGHKPSATATVLCNGMRRCDWRFILTSGI